MNKPGDPLRPTAEVVYVVSEKMDSWNAIKVSLRFRRYNSLAIFPDLRDCIIFSEGDSAEEVIKYLRGLADRLQKTCINKLKEKTQ